MPRLLALEWDAREARVAVARTRGNEIVVEHAFAVDLQLQDGQSPADSEVGKRVAAALAARNLGRTEALVAVGRTNIELRQLALPPSPVEELPELVRFQALRQFTTINDEWPIDFVPVDAGASDSLHVIAAAISPELVQQIRATCESADLTAKRLVLRPFAAASLLHRHDKNRQPPCTLMVDLLADDADLTVMVDNQVAMMRTVRTSISNGIEAQSRALLGEIRRTIAAAQNQLSGHRVERIVLCGDGSDQATLKSLIEDQLSYQVELFDPFSGLQLERELAQGRPQHTGRFAPLLGMLVDEAAGAAHAIDFLHPREKPAPPNRWRSNGLYIGLGVAACAVIALMLIISRMNMDAQIAELRDASAGLDKTVVKAKKKTDDVNRVEDFLRTDYAWLDELKTLSDTLPPADDVILTQLNMIVAPGGGQLSLDGYTRESSQIENVQQALRLGGRRVLSKGGQVDNRRDEYKWAFKETVVLTPKTDLTRNGAAKPATSSTQTLPPIENPAVDEPGPAEPATAEPATAEPATAEPATAEPVTADAPTDAPTDAPDTAPASKPDPPVAESATDEPGAADPATAEPGAAGPGAADPGDLPASEAAPPATAPTKDDADSELPTAAAPNTAEVPVSAETPPIDDAPIDDAPSIAPPASTLP